MTPEVAEKEILQIATLIMSVFRANRHGTISNTVAIMLVGDIQHRMNISHPGCTPEEIFELMKDQIAVLRESVV